MNQIDSYEKFCNAFNGGPEEVQRAELLLFIQDWIIRIIDKIDGESTEYSLDALVIENSDKSRIGYAKKDAVSRLADDSYDAVRRISENMRENIIRENVKMPVYKVREVNSYGMNWLGRRPGSTVREKISSSHASMMAVRRRMSLDTGENRLYMAYLKEMAELLWTKLEKFPKSQERQEEEQFYALILSIIRDPELEEIRRWENLPPNNTLLSDQNYKKIWRCWNELKQIDERIVNDNREISYRLCTIFGVEFLTAASRYIRFPQIPVGVCYEDYSVTLFSRIFLGIDAAGKVLKIDWQSHALHIDYDGKSVDIGFEEIKLQLTVNGEREEDVLLSPESIGQYVELVLDKLGCKSAAVLDGRKLPAAKRYHSVAMNLFAVRPEYIADNGGTEVLDGRLLRQMQIAKYDVACDQANAFLIGDDIDTYTVPAAVENASAAQMGKLMHLLGQYIAAQKFTFIFPDIYHEFQLSLVHKAARLVFPEVRSFPGSIGAAFSYMNIKVNDFLLVMDLVGDDITFTLVQGLGDENVKKDIPEYRGVVWERHPCVSYSIKEELSEFMSGLAADKCAEWETVCRLFGISGLESERNRLAAVFHENEPFLFTDRTCGMDRAGGLIKGPKMNVTDKVNDFLFQNREIIGNSQVHMVSLARQLSLKGTGSFVYCSQEKVLNGYMIYKKLQRRTSVTLWRDHLPDLAIKLLYGKFNLVDHETITPEFNVRKKIPIPNVFTLVKDMPEYHFDLVQNDADRKTRYAAVVKSPAFPVHHDVLCRLDLTYQYGSEEPYRLLFIPVEKDAGFAEAKVSWERVKEYPYRSLPYPSPLPCLSWEELSKFPGRYGVQDLVRELADTFDRIASGYECYDLRGYLPTVYGRQGKRFFVADFVKHGEERAVVFYERNQEKQLNHESGVRFDKLKLISCELQKINLDSPGRYHLDLSVGARYDGIWAKNPFGYYCYRSLQIQGKECQIAFYSENFVDPERFHTNIKKISFGLQSFDGNKMTAVQIMDEEDCVRVYYKAVNMRTGDRPGRNVYGGKMFFLLHKILAGRSSLCGDGSPGNLQAAFQAAAASWMKLYDRVRNEDVKRSIFGQMSLAAKDIGKPYYDLAAECMDDYLAGKTKYVNLNIGYALGALDNKNEKKLLRKIERLPDEKIMFIYSRAVWADENFIRNMDIPKVLYYFEFAIDYLCGIYKQKKQERNIMSCIELLLGIFRLREYGDDDVDKKLSLNNPKVRKLYAAVEEMIHLTQEKKITVKSFLKIEMAEHDGSDQNDLYKDIPIILYAMLVYITGEKGAGDIKISGLDLEDVDV